MNGNFDTLLRRSRRWGMCGTILSGAGILLGLMGLGPVQELKAQPEPRPPVVVQLMTTQPEAKANPPETPQTEIPGPPGRAPEIGEITEPEAPAMSPVVPLKKPSPQIAAPQKTVHQKTAQKSRPAPERGPQPTPSGDVGTPPPPVAGPSAASSATAKDTGEQTQALLARVVEQLEKHKRYPQAARKLGLEGVVRLQVRFSPQGGMVHIRLLDSKAHAMLCKSGLESMRKVQELWAAQPLERETVLDIAVRYTLER